MKLSIPNINARATLLALALGLAGCAAVQYTPAKLQPIAAGAESPDRTLALEAKVRMTNDRQTALKAGSTWRRVGSIAEGDVYRPFKDVFMVKGADEIHEAYLVVRNDALVGFYLPAKGAYSALGAPHPLRFTSANN